MLIAFSGLKGSGKDTAAKVLIEEYGFTKISFADAIRDALLALDPYVSVDWYARDTIRLSERIDAVGWDVAKNSIPEVRRLMQVFGTEVGRQLFGENVWVDILAKKFPDIDSPNTRYVITDCRFVNEASFVDDKSGSIVWIDRPGLSSDGHASESGEVRAWRNWLITNDESIEELEKDVRLLAHVEGFDPVARTTTAESS